MAAAGGAGAILISRALANVGRLALAGAFLVAALALGMEAALASLASRSRVGARSEDEVRRALAPLRTEGWRLRHSLQWRGRGDIDLVAIAPWGVAFALEVKTSRYEHAHLVMVREQATWLWRLRRRWCQQGAVPVLCVARGRGLHRWEDGVLVVSIDCLVPALLAESHPIERAALPF
jgi:Holliday junction resolvase-like predicted endonuclease